MISKEASLATRLSWIATDVNQLIENTEECLKIYFDDTEAKDALVDANQHLQQLRGIMDIVGSDGIVMLIREIALLNTAIIDDDVKKLSQAREALADSTVNLRDYFQHLQDGYNDLPVIILPTLNDLRAARDAELLSEHLVFLPEESEIDRSDMGIEDYVALSAADLKAAGVKLRYHFQKSLVGWYRGQDEKTSLQTLQRVSKNLIRMNDNIRLRSLWWISVALAQAVELKKLESSVAVKLLMGRLEREIRFFTEQGEAAYAQHYSNELTKNLLYYVGLAQHGGDTLDAVKTAYQLDIHLPQGETLAQLREYYQSPGKKMWQSVSGSLNQNIDKITRNIESLELATDDQDANAIKQLNTIVTDVYKVGNTLGIIGLHRASEIILSMAKELSSYAKTPTQFEREQRLICAEKLLKLKEVLAEYASTGDDITAEAFSAEGHLTNEAIRHTYSAILDSLSASQKHIAEFINNESAFFQLDNALNELRKVQGAIKLLNQTTLMPLSSGLIHYLEHLLSQKLRPEDNEKANMADLLTLYEAIIMTQQQRENDTNLLLQAYDSLDNLQANTQIELANPSLLEQTKQHLLQKKKTMFKTSSMMRKKFQTPQAIAS